jgi:hypothetical protein
VSVELTPRQAQHLLNAYWHERNRRRHEAEPWESQAQRDSLKREREIEEAVSLGVPFDQVVRFVYWEEENGA